MKVTVVSRIYLPEPAAASFRLGALVAALTRSGHDVTVLTTRPGSRHVAQVDTLQATQQAAHETMPLDHDSTNRANQNDQNKDDIAESGGRKARIKRWPVLRDATGYVRGYIPYLSFDIPAFFRVLLSTRPDVIVVEPPPTTATAVRLASALRKIPYIYYGADIWSDASATTGAPRWVVRILQHVERWTWRGARAVLSVSDGVTRRMRELEPKISPILVGNGIDVELFDDDPVPSNYRERYGRYFVYAGTASEWHGAEVFAQAMNQVHQIAPDVRLLYVGQGAMTEHIRALCAQLPADTVQFIPRTSPKETAKYLRGAVAGLASVKPNSGYDFAFPSKALASAACGTRVIYAGAPSAGATIADAQLGVAVPMTPQDVAKAMIDVLLDESELQRDPERHQLLRQVRRQWVVENASLATVAERAVGVITARTGHLPQERQS